MLGRMCTLRCFCWECKPVQQLWKAVWRFLRKLGMEPPFDPATPLLGLYPNDLKSAYYTDAISSVFITAQLTIVKLWKQPRWPSTDEWKKKMWNTHTHTHTHTREYYSVLKKNKIMAFASKWMEIENIMQNKISQTQKSKAWIFSLTCGC